MPSVRFPASTVRTRQVQRWAAANLLLALALESGDEILPAEQQACRFDLVHQFSTGSLERRPLSKDHRNVAAELGAPEVQWPHSSGQDVGTDCVAWQKCQAVGLRDERLDEVYRPALRELLRQSGTFGLQERLQ